MSQIAVISRDRHANQRWKRYTSYSFAAGDAVAPLVVQELSRACMHLPIGFVKSEQGFQLVAVQGLQPGRNLWVAPDGRWLAPYVPAAYRGFPFALATTQDGQRVLCVREDSGLLSDAEGEPFFDEEGKPAQAVQGVLNFLGQVADNADITARLSAVLAEHGLIQPWEITLKVQEGEQPVQGLYRVDEAALNALEPDAFEAVRKSGALPMVYCQLLSMQHLPKLGQLAQHHAQAQAQAQVQALMEPDTGELDLEFLKDDNIRFS